MAKRKPSKPPRQSRAEGRTIQSEWQHVVTMRYRQEGLSEIPLSDPLGWLILAADHGRLDEVKRFVEMGADVNGQHVQFFGHTPLSLAARKGNLDVVKYLVEHGADVNQPSAAGSTPLTIAAQNGNLDVVKYLVEHGADVGRVAGRDGDALTCAIHWRQFAVLEYLKPFASPRQQLIVARRLPEATRPKSETDRAYRLSEVCCRGLVPTVRRLLKQGIDVNSRTIGYRGQTPLGLAARHGHTVIVGLLLEAGADPNLESYDGKTPLMGVADADICRRLLAAGADVNATDDDGCTVLTCVTDAECRRLLMEAGAR